MRRIEREEEEGEGEGDDTPSVQYCCEQLIVGNRKTKVVQKKEKVKKEKNRRTLKKRFVQKKTICKFGKFFIYPIVLVVHVVMIFYSFPTSKCLFCC